MQGHPFHTLAELVRIEHAEAVEVLVVDPHGQHEVTELPRGDTPGHLLPHFEGLVHHLFPVGPVIDQAVRNRHILIQIGYVPVPCQRLFRRVGTSRHQDGGQQDYEGKDLFHGIPMVQSISVWR